MPSRWRSTLSGLPRDQQRVWVYDTLDGVQLAYRDGPHWTDALRHHEDGYPLYLHYVTHWQPSPWPDPPHTAGTP